MRIIPTLLLATLLTGSAVSAPLPSPFQSQKDPLNQDEVEQIREVADQPILRVKLYMKFIEERITAIKDILKDTRLHNRPSMIHDRLEEYTRLVDELQDNLDTYSDSHSDVRKPLKDLIESSAKWPDTLHAPPEDRSYDFSRTTAIEATKSLNESARKLLDDQTTYFAELKKKQKDSSAKPKDSPKEH